MKKAICVTLCLSLLCTTSLIPQILEASPLQREEDSFLNPKYPSSSIRSKAEPSKLDGCQTDELQPNRPTSWSNFFDRSLEWIWQDLIWIGTFGALSSCVATFIGMMAGSVKRSLGLQKVTQASSLALAQDDDAWSKEGRLQDNVSEQGPDTARAEDRRGGYRGGFGSASHGAGHVVPASLLVPAIRSVKSDTYAFNIDFSSRAEDTKASENVAHLGPDPHSASPASDTLAAELLPVGSHHGIEENPWSTWDQYFVTGKDEEEWKTRFFGGSTEAVREEDKKEKSVSQEALAKNGGALSTPSRHVAHARRNFDTFITRLSAAEEKSDADYRTLSEVERDAIVADLRKWLEASRQEDTRGLWHDQRKLFVERLVKLIARVQHLGAEDRAAEETAFNLRDDRTPRSPGTITYHPRLDAHASIKVGSEEWERQHEATVASILRGLEAYKKNETREEGAAK